VLITTDDCDVVDFDDVDADGDGDGDGVDGVMGVIGVKGSIMTTSDFGFIIEDAEGDISRKRSVVLNFSRHSTLSLLDR